MCVHTHAPTFQLHATASTTAPRVGASAFDLMLRYSDVSGVLMGLLLWGYSTWRQRRQRAADTVAAAGQPLCNLAVAKNDEIYKGC